MVRQKAEVVIEEPGGVSSVPDLGLLAAVRGGHGVELLAEVCDVALEDARHLRPGVVLGGLHAVHLVRAVPQLRPLPVLVHQPDRGLARPLRLAHRASHSRTMSRSIMDERVTLTPNARLITRA